MVDISPTVPGNDPVATVCRPYRASSRNADTLGDSALTRSSLAPTTSSNVTEDGSGERSSAKSERWSRAQISKNPASLMTRCRPRILPGSSAGLVDILVSPCYIRVADNSRKAFGEQNPGDEGVAEPDRRCRVAQVRRRDAGARPAVAECPGGRQVVGIPGVAGLAEVAGRPARPGAGPRERASGQQDLGLVRGRRPVHGQCPV